MHALNARWRVAPSPARARNHTRIVPKASSESASTSAIASVPHVTKRQAGVAVLGALVGTSFSPLAPPPALAIQGLTAGRIPGRSSTPDADGFYTYTRPEGKSGGHGVGWSEIPRYSFKVPDGWDERPVSIADLGGTEIDLRYSSREQGEISVVVAPILRFVDVGFNASVSIESLGDPERIIRGFGPELYGGPLDDDEILDMSVGQHNGLTYYYYMLKKDRLAAATAVKNRLIILSISSKSRQYKKHADALMTIRNSFSVNNEVVKPMA